MIVWREFRGHDQPALMEAVERLRVEVWTAQGLTLTGALRVDALDRAAHNIVACEGDLLVASSQVSRHDVVDTMRDGAHYAPLLRPGYFPAAVLNRLVVRPSHRGRGLAAGMDARRLAVAQAWGVRFVLTEVRGGRVRALQDLGFETLGISPDLRYPGEWQIVAKLLGSKASSMRRPAVPSREREGEEKRARRLHSQSG